MCKNLDGENLVNFWLVITILPNFSSAKVSLHTVDMTTQQNECTGIATFFA